MFGRYLCARGYAMLRMRPTPVLSVLVPARKADFLSLRSQFYRAASPGPLSGGLISTSFGEGISEKFQPPPRALMSPTAATICCIRKLTAVC